MCDILDRSCAGLKLTVPFSGLFRHVTYEVSESVRSVFMGYCSSSVLQISLRCVELVFRPV